LRQHVLDLRDLLRVVVVGGERDDAQAELKALLPYCSPRNPVDATAQAVTDLPVMTRSIAAMLEKGGYALNPRGEFYPTETIAERLALRNYLYELRGTGERTDGPAALDNTDRKRFADQLDRFLATEKVRGQSPKT
jgi:hypothetical protein